LRRSLVGPGMQHFHGPPEIQSLSQPGGATRPPVDVEALCRVLRAQRLDRIGGHLGRGRHFRQQLAHPAAGTGARHQAVDRPDSPPRARRGGVGGTRWRGSRAWWGRRWPSGASDALPEPHPAPREPTAAVRVLKRPPQGRGNRSGPRPDPHEVPGAVVPHHHPARVTRLTTGSGGCHMAGSAERAPALQYQLAKLVGGREYGGVDMHHHLVPLARRAGGRARDAAPSPRGGPGRRPAAGPWWGRRPAAS
jgi:hypothetical protein